MQDKVPFVFNWLFYTAKPVIPRRFQIFLRRRLAAYKRRKYDHIWPIDPNSATPPEGWEGWPDGKKFALVLSHDVDTIVGYNKVLDLAALEERLGFRSTFNFVPERYGKVSLNLLDELRRHGFSVGVHGLKHDGKLFLSRRIFERSAVRINAYLSEWKTGGFSSPSMHRNLHWMTALNIDYSICTFDTDPFEPQPDGVGTIFPFLVYRNSGQDAGKGYRIQKTGDSGENSKSSPERRTQNQESSFYIEVPYTLPQDSTLFVILQEKTIGIWKRKLDWVAEKGGMALLNTHPDYMNGSSKWGLEEYPMRFYEEFLHYIKENYEGRYWHALPKEVARFWREKMVPRENPNKQESFEYQAYSENPAGVQL